MKRTTVLALFVALCTSVIAAIGGTSAAWAQTPAAAPCPTCTFTVNPSCSIPTFCFPFVLTANWSGVISNYNVTHCGTLTFTAPPPCPPYPVLKWVSLDGGVTMVPVGAAPVAFGTLPCCVLLSATQAPGGCYSIVMTHCP